MCHSIERLFGLSLFIIFRYSYNEKSVDFIEMGYYIMQLFNKYRFSEKAILYMKELFT